MSILWIWVSLSWVYSSFLSVLAYVFALEFPLHACTLHVLTPFELHVSWCRYMYLGPLTDASLILLELALVSLLTFRGFHLYLLVSLRVEPDQMFVWVQAMIHECQSCSGYRLRAWHNCNCQEDGTQAWNAKIQLSRLMSH